MGALAGTAEIGRAILTTPGVPAERLGALRAAQESGKNDLSIVGFDDIPLASLSEPQLTTIRVPKRQMGAEVAGRILALLGNPDLSPVEVLVSVELVIRSSTRALA